jgi:hypothetical protein
MIYARAHDQTVADDYFAAMQRIEQRLQISPPGSTEEPKYGIVKVPEKAQALDWAQQLAQPELCFQQRSSIAAQLCQLFGLQEEPGPLREARANSELSSSQ